MNILHWHMVRFACRYLHPPTLDSCYYFHPPLCSSNQPFLSPFSFDCRLYIDQFHGDVATSRSMPSPSLSNLQIKPVKSSGKGPILPL
jgi:hypothetical protein